VLSKMTLANGNEDVVLHEDAPTSFRQIVNVQGLWGLAKLRSSKRVRPSAHGSLNETKFQEGRSIAISAECWSNLGGDAGIKKAREEFNEIVAAAYETLETPALLKWTEGSTGLKLQALVKLDSSIEPILHDAAAVVSYPVTFFASDPRNYAQTATTQTGANLNGNAVENKFSEASTTGISATQPIAINGSNIFYATGVYLGKMALAGGSAEAAWKEFKSPIVSVAIDASHIYVGLQSGNIARMTLAGGSIEEAWIPASVVPLGLAVNAEHVYWLFKNSGNAYIGRAAIAGTGVENGWLEIPLANPTCGLAVDSGHLYFGLGESVGRCALGGSAVEPNWIHTGNEVAGVAVSSEFVYYLVFNAPFIGRAKLAGTEVNPVFFAGVAASDGLAVNATHVYYGGQTYTTRLGSKTYIGRTVSLAAGPTGSQIVVSQLGNVSTPLVFKVYGPVTNPVVYSPAQGAGVALSGTINAGEYVELDTGARTIRLNGTANALPMLLAPLSDWTALLAPPQPISEPFKLGAASATEAKMELTYRSAYA
jgi:hypothetical protein